MSKRPFNLCGALLLALLLLFIPSIATSSVAPSASNPTQSRPCTRPDETSISHRGSGEQLHKVYDALTTCPNITSLDLDFTSSGCEPPSSPWFFTFREGDRFPKIRKLAISSYDFEGLEPIGWQPRSLLYKAQDIIGKAFPSFLQTVVKPRESNLAQWTRAMDFAALEELNLGSGNELFYKRMKNELPNLQSLSIFSYPTSNSSIPDHQLDFLNTIPPLTSISIDIAAPYSYANPPSERRALFPLAAILDKHGSTLRTLSLTQPESRIPHLHRPMLSLQNLTALLTSCPSLTHLTLDIDRNGTWPNSTLDAITAIEPLTNLTLHLEIGANLHRPSEPGSYGWNPEGLSQGGPFREPRMSLDVAERLFRDLGAKKRGRGLEKVEFVVGDYGAEAYDGPIYIPAWEEGRGRMFVCEGRGGEKAVEGGGGEGRGTVKDGMERYCRVLGDRDPYPDLGDEEPVPEEGWGGKDEL